MTGRFFCETSFCIAERRLFVLSGEVLAGTVRAGMNVVIPFNPYVSTTVEIHSIEHIQSLGSKSRIGLTIVMDNDDDLEFLKCLNIGDEELEVVEPDNVKQE